MPDAVDIEDGAALLAYLHRTERIAPEERPRFTILRGGVSNRAVLVERETGERWVMKQALEKLRVPVDWFSSPERIHREALGLEWLARLAPEGTITPLLFEDREQNLLAMQAVDEPHENWKTMLMRGKIVRDHFRQFGELLGTIHRAARGRRDLAETFGDRSYFESLRLEPYYGYAAAQAPEATEFLEALIAETRARQTTLVHGDYSPKNVLVYRDRLVLLDHEVIHFGDPAFDLGFGMTHFLSKGHHLPERRMEFAEGAREFWRAYADREDLEARAVRHTLGCLLARVAGRSPLEYLDAAERARQRGAVLRMMASSPVTVDGLIDRFSEELCR